MDPLIELAGRILLPYGGLAFVVALLSTPLAAALARALDVMDHPDQRLKPHARPIPYLGGLAIWLGWTVALTGVGIWLGRVPVLTLTTVVLGGAVLSALGLADDAHEVRPKVRLLIGAAVVALVALTTGVGSGCVERVAALLGFELPAMLARGLATLLGILVVLGACNSSNLIDGLDGLAAGTIAIVSLAFFAAAALLAGAPLSGADVARLALAAAMSGATLGFLVWNYNPARIFMGDSGSLLLGYNSGLLILLLGDAGPEWLLAGIVIFALPIYDTALAIGRRLWNRKPVFVGDRSHFYDQLRDRGLSVRLTVGVCYLLAAVFGLFGLAPRWLTPLQVAALYGGLALVTLVVTFAAGLVRVDRPRS